MHNVTDHLRALYENTPVLVAAYDPFDRLRYANRAFRAAFFIEPEEEPFWPELMRRNFHAGRGTVIRAPDFEEWLVSTLSRRGKAGFRAFETDLADGHWLWMTETVDTEGWMLCIASDITSLRAEDRAVRQDRDFAIKAAQTDDLTGIANRRYVTTMIEEMLNQAAPNAASAAGCVAVLDLDNFKYINDRYGHHVGDVVLRDFARRIQAQVRRTDCFGRVGGEEFVLVLPGTSAAQAALLIERMLTVIRRSRPLSDRPEFGYTFSAGVSESLSGDSVASLYARADKALYAAKLAGRNQLVTDDPAGESTPRQA
jgi:diguanylate cyclase (GGDEF)-like protein